MNLKQAIKELNSVGWIGEDGDMAIACKTKVGAWKRMRAITRDDCGDYEASEIKIDKIGIGWLHISTPEDKKRFWENHGEENVEWFVEFAHNTPKGRQVWVLVT